METNENTETTTETQVQETPELKTLDLWAEKQAPISVKEDVIVEPIKEVIETKIETPITESPKEVIKEVEKIIEKLPEFKDDFSKQLYEAIAEGRTDEVYDYLIQSRKDYSTMSDLDVVKENLKLNNPQWTEKDIQAEIRFKFGKMGSPKDLSDLDPILDKDAYNEAVAFNEALEEKELLLSRESRDARIALEANKKTIEFPKIAKEETQVAPQLTPDEIDEFNRKWEAKVDTDLAQLSDLKFKVGDEEVVYKITDADKAESLAYMRDYDGEKMAKDLGWIDENGIEVPLKIAEDMLILKNLDKIIASSRTQMKTESTKEVVAEIKNLNLKSEQTSVESSGVDIGDLIWGTKNNP